MDLCAFNVFYSDFHLAARLCPNKYFIILLLFICLIVIIITLIKQNTQPMGHILKFCPDWMKTMMFGNLGQYVWEIGTHGSQIHRQSAF